MSTNPIPPGLKYHLPNPETPWHVNDRLFKRIGDELYANDANTYKKCELFQEDPEADFILKYFTHNKPPNHSISAVYYIHTPSLSKQFEAHIETLNTKAETFKPEWDKEDSPNDRRLVIDRWEKQGKEFFPVTLQQSHKNSRQDTYPNVRVIPVWHGTSADTSEHVASSGFACFGKHHYFDPRAKKGRFGSTDKGYFGSGYYFTNSAKYAWMYASIAASGGLLLSWISMTEPYPVINDVPHPNKGADMRKLEGHGGYQAYNAHFAPVAPVSSGKDCMMYYACSSGQNPVCDEFVVFQGAQILPQFWIELAPDLTKQPVLKLPLKSYPVVPLPNLLSPGTSQYTSSINISQSHSASPDRNPAWNMLMCVIAGGLLGAVGGSALVEKDSKSSSSNGWDRVILAVLGGAFGILGGVGLFLFRSQRQPLLLDYQKIENQLNKESDKAAKIIHAFVSSRLEKSAEQIICPLSETLLLFPARVTCGSVGPHIFEYYSIMRWLLEHPTCPTCKTDQVLGIEHVEFDKKRKKDIKEKIHQVFLQLETLLEGLPRDTKTGVPSFSEEAQMAYLTEKIQQGSSFLQMNISQIIQKIQYPNSLRMEERYALGHYLVHYIQSIKEKIDEIYKKSTALIKETLDQTDDKQIVYILQKHQRQLWKWHRQKDAFLPEACTILQRLCYIKI